MNETTDKLIRDLAEKLGTTADHLWQVLVRQAPITAITQLVIWGLITATFTLLLIAGVRRCKKEGDDVAICTSISAGLGLGICLLWFAFDGHAAITALLNPEYWALKQIIK